jgi:hypothetical protein
LEVKKAEEVEKLASFFFSIPPPFSLSQLPRRAGLIRSFTPAMEQD